MLFLENLQLAIEGLRSNKMRSLLTMLGIIIGIGSVIGIVTVGDSMTASVTSAMEGLGATNMLVNLQSKDADRSASLNNIGGASIKEEDLLTDEMIDTYMEAYGDSVIAVSLSNAGGPGRAQEGRLYANVTVVGTNVGYGTANNVEMISGRYLRDGDIKANRYVAVVSDKFVSNMFPSGKNPLGQEIKVSVGNNLQTFTIVGVYKHEQTMMMPSFGPDKDIRTDLYIPITTNRAIASIDRGYQNFIVMLSSSVDARKMVVDTQNFFNTFYASNPRYEVNAISMESMMSAMTTMMGTLSVAVAVIAGISLIVGGVGVMNIMLVSVTERTREIGTRKALGARNSAIRTQFIVEAIIVCAIGGIIGIVTGIALGYLGGYLLDLPTFPTPFIIVVAVVFSMLIGVFFGYYPANKAAGLDPIEALRYE
ncbi:MAG: ABC transporter permease [Clostridiales bacterium]|jgi:putative ABC transport system permease protein|nr:ABC transporter permease [Clostridiales bacterium]